MAFDLGESKNSEVMDFTVYANATATDEGILHYNAYATFPTSHYQLAVTMNTPSWIQWNKTYVQYTYDQQAWSAWNNVYDYGLNGCNLEIQAEQQAEGRMYRHREQTATEVADQRARQEQARARHELFRQQQMKAKLDADEAKKKAEQLLFLCLNAEQKESYRVNGYFETTVNDRVYRINSNSRSGNVKLLDPETKRIAISFCIHPEPNIPIPDVMLAQKLLLEADERQFLCIANATQIGPPERLNIAAIERAMRALDMLDVSA